MAMHLIFMLVINTVFGLTTHWICFVIGCNSCSSPKKKRNLFETSAENKPMKLLPHKFVVVYLLICKPMVAGHSIMNMYMRLDEVMTNHKETFPLDI